MGVLRESVEDCMKPLLVSFNIALHRSWTKVRPEVSSGVSLLETAHHSLVGLVAWSTYAIESRSSVRVE